MWVGDGSEDNDWDTAAAVALKEEEHRCFRIRLSTGPVARRNTQSSSVETAVFLIF
jgi:hypothetical protein